MDDFGGVPTVAAHDLARWVAARAADRPAPDRRYLFGIVGPPGSGKSTLAARLADALSAPVVAMDGFHLSNATLVARDLRDVKGAPHTFDAAGFVDTVERLQTRGAEVATPTFDRTIDEPVANATIVGADDAIVIVEGNYLLVDEAPWSKLTTLLDAVGYLDVPDDVRIDRLIARHVEFGKTSDEASDFVRRSDERNTEVIAATRGRATLIIE